MKSTSTLVLSLIFCGITIFSQAQGKKIPINEPIKDKPKLFQSLPEKISLNTSTLDNILSLDANRPATVDVAGIQFQGNIVSKTENDITKGNTVIMHLTNFPGANFTLTKTMNADGSINYIGRIISFQHGDLYELQNQKGNWVLIKKNFYDLINE